MHDFAAVLGRLNFAMEAIDPLRPFLGPMYTWFAAMGGHLRMTLPQVIIHLRFGVRGFVKLTHPKGSGLRVQGFVGFRVYFQDLVKLVADLYFREILFQPPPKL